MIEALIRTKSALESIPFITTEQEGLMNEWYNQLLYPSNPLEDSTDMSLAVRADFNELICYAQNGKKELAVQFLEIMKTANFQPVEEKLFKKLYQELKEETLRGWLKLSPTTQESGWVFDGVFPLDLAIAALPNSKTSNHKALFTEWYSRQEADACVKLGRAASSSAYSFLHTELFGSTISEDLEIYSELMQHLQITALPSPLVELILDEAPEFIEMSFYFASNGIVRSGLSISNPTQALVIKLALVLGQGASDNLGAFEGSLGKDRVKSLEIYRTSQGVFADFSY